jgi:hypothetical protein
METKAKHFRFINSQTDNTIYYYSLSEELSTDQANRKLETVKAQVAVSNGVLLDTLYWEEVKEDWN